ncbi:transposase, partial [Colletotrichum orchidophilum]
FTLLNNIIIKYNINNEDLYNFNEINFIISVITELIIVTYINKYKKTKFVEFNNRK